jgi:hypothetical protein
MSIGYTKLFSSIVTSTIWVESDRTRIVWITMLAMADRNGEIQASIPGLARLAGVPIPDCEEALAKFIAPDRYSRTPDDEGRRIEKIEGGWALLNHAKYREMASKDDSKAANTERQRRHREKEKRNATVTPRNATVTPSNVKVTHDLHIAEAEAEAEAGNTHTAPVPVAAGDEAPAADCPFPPEVAHKPSARELEAESVWALYPKKKGKKEAMREVLNAIRTEGIERIRERVKAYADAVSQWSQDDRKYVPDPVRWFKRGNYDDDPKEWQRNAIPESEKSEYNEHNAW